MTDRPLDLDAIRARHDDPESCADTVAMLAALDARDAEIRRLTALVRVVQAELASEARAHNQTIADRDHFHDMADKLAAVQEFADRHQAAPPAA